MIFNLNTLSIYTEDLHHKLQQTEKFATNTQWDAYRTV